MIPAQQGLQSQQPPGEKIELGLIIPNKLPALQGLPEIGLQTWGNGN